MTTLQRGDGDWETTVFEYAYAEERECLWQIIDSLYTRNQDRFESREDVFELFARAALTGRLLDLSRLIEHTFGPGAFRKLASD